jgi:hypothetical protein
VSRFDWREGGRAVLDGLRRIEQQVFAEAPADELHALRQAVVTSHGNRARRQTEDVNRNHHSHAFTNSVVRGTSPPMSHSRSQHTGDRMTRFDEVLVNLDVA